ncbi:(4Fe-4S)-binding protein [Flexithrix dorotheae]|uniref:(4Fe-4S)-binding protein n=1 Tax=Flexithrix dorotheae TaxID=70993 RepID=UPI000377621F|nr:(4Fe-4S)-binding protein [Flexithrix dorotheae]
MSDKKDVVKEYSNGEITVVWEPHKCIHSTNCWKGLYNVFNPNKRPWIKMDGSSSERISQQVDKCPSGALTWYNNEEEKPEVEAISIEVFPNGPLLIKGDILIKHSDGREEKKIKSTAFCRCGASGNKPFCDGTHKKIDFKG